MACRFDDYVEAIGWAQDYARRNRVVMMQNLLAAARTEIVKPFGAEVEAVDCHHNYLPRETRCGAELLVTRKGAVSARKGNWGSSRARRGRGASSCAGWAIRTRSVPAAMAPGC